MAVSTANWSQLKENVCYIVRIRPSMENEVEITDSENVDTIIDSENEVGSANDENVDTDGCTVMDVECQLQNCDGENLDTDVYTDVEYQLDAGDENVDTDKLFPPGYTYTVLSKGIVEIGEIKDKDGAEKWVIAYGQHSNTTWRVRRSYRVTGQRLIFKKDWNCHHKVQQKRVNEMKMKRRTSKNLDCPATLRVRILKLSEKKKRKTGVQCDRQCVVHYKLEHNHPLDTAEVLRFHPMSENVKQTLMNLILLGHGASSARRFLKLDMYLNDPEYWKHSPDGRYVPSVAICQKLLNSLLKSTDGAKAGRNMDDDSKQRLDEDLMHYLEKYHTEHPQGKAICGSVLDHKYVAFCTPLMSRAHLLVPEASELMRVDASGYVDKNSHRVYFFSTPTPAGEIPLGCIVTDVEKLEVFEAALTSLKSCMPTESFNSQHYPSTIVTDVDPKERQALKNIWPESKLLLCQYHVLKAVWNWLLEGKHSIPIEVRHYLYQGFRKLIYDDNEKDLEEDYSVLQSFHYDYPHFLAYVEKLWTERKLWASAYCGTLPTCGNDTNNYAEIVFRMIKDYVLDGIRTRHLTPVVDFLLTKYEQFMKRCFLDFAYDRFSMVQLEKYLTEDEEDLDSYTVRALENPELFEIINTVDNIVHVVDIKHGFCTCTNSSCERLCYHLSFMIKMQNLQSDLVTVSPRMKEILFEIATGNKPPLLWLLPLSTKLVNVPILQCHSSPTEPVLSPGTSNSDFCSDENDDILIEQDSTDVDSMEKQITLTEDERNEWKLFLRRIDNGIKRNPRVFVPAMRKAVANIRKYVKTDSALVSALHALGRHT